MQTDDFDDEPSAEPRPSMSTYSVVVEELRGLRNEVRLMRAENVGIATGGKPPTPQLLFGPKTAMEDVQGKSRIRDHLLLSARLLPHKRDEYLARAEEI